MRDPYAVDVFGGTESRLLLYVALVMGEGSEGVTPASLWRKEMGPQPPAVLQPPPQSVSSVGMVRRVRPPGLTVSCSEMGSFSLELVLKAGPRVLDGRCWEARCPFSLDSWKGRCFLILVLIFDSLVRPTSCLWGAVEAFQQQQRWGEQTQVLEGKGPGASRSWEKEDSLLTS